MKFSLCFKIYSFLETDRVKLKGLKSKKKNFLKEFNVFKFVQLTLNFPNGNSKNYKTFNLLFDSYQK